MFLCVHPAQPNDTVVYTNHVHILLLINKSGRA